MTNNHLKISFSIEDIVNFYSNEATKKQIRDFKGHDNFYLSYFTLVSVKSKFCLLGLKKIGDENSDLYELLKDLSLNYKKDKEEFLPIMRGIRSHNEVDLKTKAERLMDLYQERMSIYERLINSDIPREISKDFNLLAQSIQSHVDSLNSMYNPKESLAYLKRFIV